MKRGGQQSMQFPESLTEGYRPRRVQDFCGIPKPKRTIRNFLKRPRPTAWLFYGPSGRGKTIMGMVMAEAIAAELHHIPSGACDLETIDSVARLCHRGAFNFFGKNAGKSALWHVVLVDEADKMTSAAQLRFYSLLDSTAFPPNTIFVFTSNNAEQFEPRFLSRLFVLNFDAEGMNRSLPKYLASIAAKEKYKGKLDFSKLARDVDYNVRDALMKLELELLGAGYLSASY